MGGLGSLRTGSAADNSYADQSVGKTPIRVLVYGPRALLTADGRLVVVGTLSGSGATDLAVWRFWP